MSKLLGLLSFFLLLFILPAGCRTSDQGNLKEELGNTDISGCVCFNTAKLYSLGGSTREACASPNANTCECITSARDIIKDKPGDTILTRATAPISTSQTATLCAKALPDSQSCIMTARMHKLSANEILKVCLNPTPQAQYCLNAARIVVPRMPGSTVNPSDPLSTSATVELCSVASDAINGCIDNERHAGKSASSIADTCKEVSRIANPNAGACLKAATEALQKHEGATAEPTAPLSSQTAVGICKTGGASAGDCITAARHVAMREANIYNLCKSGEAAIDLCVVAALGPVQSPGPSAIVATPALKESNALGLCMKAKEETSHCVMTARNAGIVESTIASMCSNGTPFTSACIVAARTAADEAAKAKILKESYTAGLCTAAKDSTAQCITDAMAANITADQIVNMCR